MSLQKHILSIIFLLCFFTSFEGLAQQSGCTDPRATNFNPSAAVNDGSCTYSITTLNPPFAFELPNAVKETSGLILLNGKLITFNDSGGNAILFAVDTVSGQIVQQFNVSNASNVDWEDIALDEDFVYIGDFGNNSGTRKDLVVYKLSRDDFPQQGHATIPSSRIDFYYPDQNDFTRSKNHNFDCEAIIASGDSLYLFSKNRGDGKSKLYRLPKVPGNYAAQLMAEFDVRGLITGADKNPVSGDVVLTGYTQGSYMPFVWLLFDYQNNQIFGGNKRRIELINLVTTQVEGVTFTIDKNLMISAEKSPTFSARVFKFGISDWTDYVNNLNENLQKRHKPLELIGNPVDNKVLRFKTSKDMGNQLKVDVFDSTGMLVKTVHPEMFMSEGYVDISLVELTQGTYHISVYTKRRIYTAAFILL